MSKRKLNKKTQYIELYGRVQIKPQDLVGDIDFKIEDATKIKYENSPYVAPEMGKDSDKIDGPFSDENIFVITVIKIVDRKAAPFIRDEIGDNCGIANYDVKFQAKVMKLQPKDYINAQVLTIHRSVSNDVIIFAKNGQILVFMNSSHIDTSVFTVTNKGDIIHKATGKYLEKDDYINIEVIDTEMYLNDSNMKIIGYLKDLVN